MPREHASRFERVVEVRAEQVGALDLGPIAARDFWLIVHRSKQRVPTVRAVTQWLGSLSFSR